MKTVGARNEVSKVDVGDEEESLRCVTQKTFIFNLITIKKQALIKIHHIFLHWCEHLSFNINTVQAQLSHSLSTKPEQNKN